ncbi:viral a-type inclusion protein [Diplodia corticola]|uniref:Viral a-type inclusion protein n=1 Tax=Diplodia corticola TaxID=236234 RepID=A0A1J9S510_9PEZI|nr:viral a-type inclusion protein [Diplodia corticola]OJD34709.1 viral a-type inclusion protein [Diplodia corticola]
MASKFFLWTKTDRHNAAGACRSYRVDGLISVDQYPAGQWDSPSDLAGSKKRKKKHRPKPLPLSTCGSHSDFDASAIAPASALHETTMTSGALVSNVATANDRPRSPALDNPLPSPTLGRPRSHTAPPTPTIAELPGSILLENQGFPSAVENAVAGQEGDLAAKRQAFASALQVPAPTKATQHKKSLSLNTATSRWAPDAAAGSSRAPHPLFHRPSVASRSSSHASSQRKRGDRSDNSSVLRSPITEVTEASSAVAFAGSESSNVSAKQQPMRQPQVSEPGQLKAAVVTQDKQIALLKSQFQHLRISHEAHASTLAEAHRREMDAMRAYVHYLEESRDCKPPHPHLTIPARGLRGASPQISPTFDQGKEASFPGLEVTRTKSDDSSTMKRTVNDRLGNEASITSGEGQERINDLNRRLDLATRQIAAMKDQMEQLVARKDAYKDRAADLEVRVNNNHEMLIDLRESEYKLEMERRLMHERYRELRSELDALRTQPEQSRIGDLEKSLADERLRAELLSTQLETMQLRTPLPNTITELTKTIDDLKRQLKEKDEQIYELQHVNQALKLDLEEMDTQQARLAAGHDEALAQESRERKAVKEQIKQLDHENAELKEIVEAQGEDLVTVQDEYEHLRKLLHSEMRSQARQAISRSLIPGTPSSADGYLELVAAETRRRVKALIAKENGKSSQHPLNDPKEHIRQLEQEIEHHVNELVRCKRDNRGYRKDIKRANTKLDKMRNSMCSAGNVEPNHLQRHLLLQRPITPTTDNDEKSNMDGLGISAALPSPANTAPPSQPTSTVSGTISDVSFPPVPSMIPGRSRSNTNKQLPPYPSLPEQIPENASEASVPASDPSASNPPPPPSSTYSQDQPPPSYTSRPRTPRTPISYKLTPTINDRTPTTTDRTASVSSILPNPAVSPAMIRRPPTQRYYSSEHNNNITAGPPPPAVAAAAAAPRDGTHRSLSENIASNYAAAVGPSIGGGGGGGGGGEEQPRPKTSSSSPKSVRRRRRQQQQQDPAATRAEEAAADDGEDDSTLTALPQRPPSGWKAERKSQEEKLGLIRSNSQTIGGVGIEGIAGRALKRAATSGANGVSGAGGGGGDGAGRKKGGSNAAGGLGAQGVVSRFNHHSSSSSSSAMKKGGLRGRAGTTGGIVCEGEERRSWRRGGEVVVPVVLEGAGRRV